MAFTTEEHWKFFAEFCAGELKAGGPDPHLLLAAKLSEGQPLAERFWRAGCYIAVYNAPFGEALWRSWSWKRINKEPEALLPWLQANWPKIITRRERRCVRRADWMNEYLLGYAKFARTLPKLLKDNEGLLPELLYGVMWGQVLTVPRLGRYVALKLLEFYRVCCGVEAVLPDLRPKGGWSPRQTLGDLWPEHKTVAERDDAPTLLTLANDLTNKTQAKLAADFGVTTDKFKLQVLLCDYKQSWKGRRQYPGRSIDSELLYVRQAEELWEYKSGIWEARRALFPVEQLGEVQGWTGPREGPANVLADYKYTWSDLKFDYCATKDMGKPVLRIDAFDDGPLKGTTLLAVSSRVHPILEGKLYQSGSWNTLSLAAIKALVEYYRITGVVSLWKGEHDLSDAVSWHERFPMSDGRTIPVELRHLVASIVARIEANERVVVMCHAGRNRSALVTSLVVRSLLRCSGEKAIALVRAKRPRSLANPNFEKYVLKAALPPQKGMLF